VASIANASSTVSATAVATGKTSAGAINQAETNALTKLESECSSIIANGSPEVITGYAISGSNAVGTNATGWAATVSMTGSCSPASMPAVKHT